MSDPSFVFSKNINEFEGVLDCYISETESYSFAARSGLPHWQGHKNKWLRGKGNLPESIEIDGEYSVITAPKWSEKAQAVCFHILPDPVKNRMNPFEIRSELFIHFDAGVEGTAGCIGIRRLEDANDFARIMAGLYDEGIKSVPLQVIYEVEEAV